MAKNKREMQSDKLKKKTVSESTQLFLDIAEIKNDTVILKDSTLRAVLMVSSVNFALKSEEEQEAIVSAYVGFLNYLEFPIQIVVQSRKLNIDIYLNKFYFTIYFAITSHKNTIGDSEFIYQNHQLLLLVAP